MDKKKKIILGLLGLTVVGGGIFLYLKNRNSGAAASGGGSSALPAGTDFSSLKGKSWTNNDGANVTADLVSITKDGVATHALPEWKGQAMDLQTIVWTNQNTGDQSTWRSLNGFGAVPFSMSQGRSLNGGRILTGAPDVFLLN